MIVIDDRVQALCGELNQLSTVQTFSSCGGHPDAGPGQADDGTFYVNFYLDFNEDGEDDLDRITFAAGRFLGDEDEPGEFEEFVGSASVTAWWNGDFEKLEGTVCFEVRGNCDPIILARELRDAPRREAS